jgi:hypothetical protein
MTDEAAREDEIRDAKLKAYNALRQIVPRLTMALEFWDKVGFEGDAPFPLIDEALCHLPELEEAHEMYYGPDEPPADDQGNPKPGGN